jgi:broad specificity phosphatase PhoE
MAVLFLVRHAQASFLSEDYDHLSLLGESQAARLGEYWASRKTVFHRAAVGPRRRHAGTARFVRDAYRAASLSFPNPEPLPEFDEYDAQNAFDRGLPALLETDQNIRALHAAVESAPERSARGHTFQKLFEAVISKWVEGAISPADVEPWSDFSTRVTLGLTKFLAAGTSGERVVIFTSGGPIAVAMQRALALSSQKTLEVSWMSRNCSWSEFLYSAGRFTLSSFNVHAHLDDPAMLTHR